MNGAAHLESRHIFGIKTDVRDNVWYLEENVLLYAAGQNVVVYHTETKTQRFLPSSEGSGVITALAVSPNRRYVAVAEKGRARGSVSIYDLQTFKKRKVLTTSECTSCEYVSLCFSSNQMLLTLGGAPDWALVLWQWEKAKTLSSVKVSNAAGSALTQCSFNPVDPSVACVTGEGIFKAFRIVDGALKPMPNLLGQMEPQNFTAHLWLNDDRVVLGTDTGKLVLFEAGEFLATLKCSPDDGQRVAALAALADGFLAGCEGGEVRAFASVDDEHGYYKETRAVNACEASNAASGFVPLSGPGVGGLSGMGATMATLASGPTRQRLTRLDTSSTAAATARKQSTSMALLQGQGGAGHGHGAQPGQQGQGLGPCEPDAFEESVSSISVAPSEDRAVVTLNTNQMMVVTLTKSDLGKQDNMACAPLGDCFHRFGLGGVSRITGLDVCVRKPLVVTCGLDRSVRVWNYADNCSEASKVFAEEAHSVSFHPSGLHVLVGFSDKLRLMNVLMDDLRPAKELPIKACRECQFAAGGHLFAAVNGSTIQVFNTYTCECTRTLRGHNGKVRSLFWANNDSQIVSAGMDGAVYQWDLKESKRDGEYVKKGCNYSSALSNKSGDAVFAVGSDGFLREVEFPVSVVTKEIDCRSVLSQLALSGSQRMLFGATGDEGAPGAVRSFKFPLTGDFTEYASLATPITRMRLSWEDRFLFVAGEDGTLQVFQVKERDMAAQLTAGAAGAAGAAGEEAPVAGAGAGSQASGGSGKSSSPSGGSGSGSLLQVQHYSEEILVTKSDLEERSTLMLELKSKVDELTLHNEYQLRLKDMNYNEKIKDVTEKFTQELEQDKNRYELLREEKNDVEMEYSEKIKSVEDAHQLRLQEMESTYQTKIMTEVERYQDLCHERDQQRAQWSKQQQLLVESHEGYINEVTMDYEQQLQDDVALKEQLAGEGAELKREFDETMRQLEGDIDKEIELLKSKFEGKLGAEREATLRFKGENGIMKKKFSALQKDIEAQKEDIKAILDKEQDLVVHIHTLEKEIHDLRAQIRDRDETIGDKEKRIYDLKKRNQELEKFKFVLDYKIKELKRQIEPRENEIADMKDQIKEMDKELEQYHKSNADLDALIGDLRQKLDTMQGTIMANRQRLSEQKTKMSRFKSALHDCSQQVQHPDRLKDSVKQLLESSVKEHVKTEAVDVDIKREYHRQKNFLEQSADGLKRRLQTDVHKHREDNMSVMEKNMALIKEIKDLRHEIRTAKLSSITGDDALDNGPEVPAKTPKKPKKTNMQAKSSRRGILPASATAPAPASPQELQLIAEQRDEIGRLKALLRKLQTDITTARPGSASGRRLDPI